MNRLTKAAELYLKDFLILDEARKELDQFLDHLLERIYDSLANELKNLSEETYEWKIWSNKSSSGTIQLELSIKSPAYKLLRQNKTDIYVQYKDIRQTTRITNPMSVEISIFCPRMSKRLEQELNQKANEQFGSDITGFQYLVIETANAGQTVEEVVNRMIESCQQINEIIDGFRTE